MVELQKARTRLVDKEEREAESQDKVGRLKKRIDALQEQVQ